MPFNTSRSHILLIEHRVRMQARLRQIISPHYALTVVSNHQEALQLMHDRDSTRMGLELIITELSLAKINHFEWIKTLRATAITANLPLLLLTTEAEAETCLVGLGAGATDYIFESASRAEWLTRIQGALSLGSQWKQPSISLNNVDFLTGLLRKLPEAVVATDLDNKIIYLNAKAENLYGVQGSHLIGHSLSTLYQCHWLQPEDEAIAVKSLATVGEWHGENKHICKDGQVLHIATSLRANL